MNFSIKGIFNCFGPDWYIHTDYFGNIFLKEAKRKGHKAWVSYDTLYIDGKSVKDESD